MNLELLISEIREASGQTPRHRPGAAAAFGRVSHHSGIAGYLTQGICDEGYVAADLRICGYSRLVQENLESAGPGDLIYPHGFLVFATSIGGNALCADAGTGHLYWFDQGQFSDFWITWKDPVTGELQECEDYSAANIRNAGIKLADGLEDGLHSLLGGEFDDFISRNG